MTIDFERMITSSTSDMINVLAYDLPATTTFTVNEWIAVVGRLNMTLIQDGPSFSADEWRTASLAADNGMRRESEASEDRITAVVRRLNLAMAIISRLGASDDGTIRDPMPTARLFLAELPLTIDEASVMAPKWRSLDLTKMRKLRAAKNMITPLLEIAPLVSEGPINAELRKWMGLYSQLP